ncbi:Hvo_1808 family surface protein [Haloarchaeobius sp. TZWWS8]|uniref:Hvo_1808 family surface protein n=1 Tax=Haloarchaeobius sp. TZWWS8 TaxID=3446121 RepID=UPI003EBF9FF6
MKATTGRTLLLVLFVLVAGCLGGQPSTEGNGTFADPANDQLGWENGYWYNEPISVDQSDGLSQAELDAWLARSMARVEHLRQLEFERPVKVEVITREEHRKRTANETSEDDTPSKNRWNDEVWAALFISEESNPIETEFKNVSGSAVLGFYKAGSDTIVIVTDDPEQSTVSNTTFVHELVHALQDQHFDIKAVKKGATTQDKQLASNGLIEGEANYVEALYLERCKAGTWECVKSPKKASGGSRGDVNLGILVTIFQPYSDGPWFVHQQVESSGWGAMNELWKSPPVSSSAIIHGDGITSPVNVTVEDRARNGWKTFEHGTDTVGEASIFTMFWYQQRQYNITATDTSNFGTKSGTYDTYDYRSQPSTGWVGDAVLPYQKDGEYGHVWVTEWATEADAEEFRTAYAAVIEGHGGNEVGQGTYVIPSGGFADAYRVERSGTTVTVVNGPRLSDLNDIRP